MSSRVSIDAASIDRRLSQRGFQMSDEPQADQSERSRIEFLDHELDLCETFLDVSVVESADLTAACAARSKAQKGYDVALTWISSIQDASQRDRLMTRLFNLRKRLDDSM